MKNRGSPAYVTDHVFFPMTFFLLQTMDAKVQLVGVIERRMDSQMLQETMDLFSLIVIVSKKWSNAHDQFVNGMVKGPGPDEWERAGWAQVEAGAPVTFRTLFDRQLRQSWKRGDSMGRD